jgi:hypothetical protein
MNATAAVFTVWQPGGAGDPFRIVKIEGQVPKAAGDDLLALLIRADLKVLVGAGEQPEGSDLRLDCEWGPEPGARTITLAGNMDPRFLVSVADLLRRHGIEIEADPTTPANPPADAPGVRVHVPRPSSSHLVESWGTPPLAGAIAAVSEIENRNAGDALVRVIRRALDRGKSPELFFARPADWEAMTEPQQLEYITLTAGSHIDPTVSELHDAHLAAEILEPGRIHPDGCFHCGGQHQTLGCTAGLGELLEPKPSRGMTRAGNLLVAGGRFGGIFPKKIPGRAPKPQAAEPITTTGGELLGEVGPAGTLYRRAVDRAPMFWLSPEQYEQVNAGGSLLFAWDGGPGLDLAPSLRKAKLEKVDVGPERPAGLAFLF